MRFGAVLPKDLKYEKILVVNFDRELEHDCFNTRFLRGEDCPRKTTDFESKRIFEKTKLNCNSRGYNAVLLPYCLASFLRKTSKSH